MSETACSTVRKSLDTGHPGSQADHRCYDLAFGVPYILLKAALNHGHSRVRFAGVIDGLLHQHLQGRKLLILRALQVPDLLLQLRHIALQIPYFLAGRKRQRGRRNQNPYARRGNILQLSLPAGGKPSGPSPAAVCLASVTAYARCEVHVPVFCQHDSLARAERLILPVADGLQPVGRHPQLLQDSLAELARRSPSPMLYFRRARARRNCPRT